MIKQGLGELFKKSISIFKIEQVSSTDSSGLTVELQ